MIVRRGKKYCVVSKKGKNLGCGGNEAWAKKRLATVEYFKHAHKSLAEESIVGGLDDGSLQVGDQELSGFIVQNKSLLDKVSGVVYDDDFIHKHLPLIDYTIDESEDDGFDELFDAVEVVEEEESIEPEETLANQIYQPPPATFIPEPDEHIEVLLSRVQKADDQQTKCLKYVYLKYRIYYSGQKIYLALKMMNAKKYAQAAVAFEEARDGFEAKKNPMEYNCLDDWSKKAESMTTPAEA